MARNRYKEQSVKEVVDRLIANHLEDFRQKLEDETHFLIECDTGFDSPIEKMMCAALKFAQWDWWSEHNVIFMPYIGIICPEEEIIKSVVDCSLVTICRQHPIGKYRADFAIFAGMATACDKYLKVAVECDGHDFHEKTKTQASSDKARDRYFQKEGWHVLRFTGSDIYRNPEECAQEVADFVSHRADELMHGPGGIKAYAK